MESKNLPRKNIRGYLIFLIISYFFPLAKAQDILVSTTKDEVWQIEFSLSPDVYRKMKGTSSKKVAFKPDTFLFNGVTLSVDKMHTRGKTTLNFWRKSYTVSLKNDISLNDKSGAVRLDHFYLISMSLDKHYFHNRLAFQCLAQLDLFPLYYHYAEVIINGQSEGLYLVVQRPSDYALDDLGSTGILRRGSTDFTTKEKFANHDAKITRQKCRKTFKQIKYSGTRSGSELFHYLNERIDLSEYFSWLAFNYLVRNGDYTDEVFYYVLPDQSSTRFGIIPWDFDDILVKAPHEGIELRDQHLGRQLIFSGEDLLDRKIARDTFLYNQYLLQFRNVLKILDSEMISKIFNEIHQELAPYFQSNSIIAASQHDFRPTKNWSALELNLEVASAYLQRRTVALQRLVKFQ